MIVIELQTLLKLMIVIELQTRTKLMIVIELQPRLKFMIVIELQTRLKLMIVIELQTRTFGTHIYYITVLVRHLSKLVYTISFLQILHTRI